MHSFVWDSIVALFDSVKETRLTEGEACGSTAGAEPHRRERDTSALSSDASDALARAEEGPSLSTGASDMSSVVAKTPTVKATAVTTKTGVRVRFAHDKDADMRRLACSRYARHGVPGIPGAAPLPTFTGGASRTFSYMQTMHPRPDDGAWPRTPSKDIAPSRSPSATGLTLAPARGSRRASALPKHRDLLRAETAEWLREVSQWRAHMVSAMRQIDYRRRELDVMVERAECLHRLAEKAVAYARTDVRLKAARATHMLKAEHYAAERRRLRQF